MLFDNFTFVDLSHTLSSTIPTWDNSCGFHLKIRPDNDEITINTSSGTHLDAPSHFLEEKLTIDEISLQQLFVPACVIDVSAKAKSNYVISLQDVYHYETNYGPIIENSIVIGYSGWSRYWTNPKAYRNVNANGEMEFPVFSIQVIEYLLQKKIAGIGTDCFSPEPIRLSNFSYPVHKMLFKERKYIIENIANCDLLPPKGAYIIALPLKIQNGGEAPTRVVALIPKK